MGSLLSRRGSLRFVLASTVCVALTAGCGGPGGTPSPLGRDYVLKPDGVHYGASYSAWSARWWQWAMEHPLTNHPLFDPVGTHVAEWQVDPVWFLGGIFGSLLEPSTGFAERTITVPSGIALFFPIINVEVDNGQCLPSDWGVKSLSEMRQWAYDAVNAVVDVYCEVDGDMIFDSPDLAGAVEYRAMASEFSASLPADNTGVATCGEPAVPLFVDPIASDGIWLMLAPMAPGEHTIRFGGTFPTFGFHLDIIYHITVEP